MVKTIDYSEPLPQKDWAVKKKDYEIVGFKERGCLNNSLTEESKMNRDIN